MNAATDRKVWGREAEQTNEPNPRHIANLEHKLKIGKMLFADKTTLNEDGRKVSTLVTLKQSAENNLVVGIEVYYTSDDVGSLSDEESTFATLEEAKAFIHRKTGLQFDQMYRNGQNQKLI